MLHEIVGFSTKTLFGGVGVNACLKEVLPKVKENRNTPAMAAH